MVLSIYSHGVSFAMTCSFLTLVYKGACDWPSGHGSGLEAYLYSNQLQILPTLNMKNKTYLGRGGGGRGAVVTSKSRKQKS